MSSVIKKFWLIAILFFSVSHFAHASFEITEIMYDLDGTDTSREWVEVANTGTESADLSKWYLFSDNTKHALVPQGASSVDAGAYAVIVQDVTKFKQDWPNYTGLIFDSSWTGFNNDGESISLKDADLNVFSPITFTSSQGAAGDGNSLQNVSGTWVGAIPTVGKANQASTITQDNGSSNGSGDISSGGIASTSSAPIAKPKKEVEIPKITTDIISKNVVFAGLPFSIDAHTLGYSKEPLTNGKFIWNFGDGVSKEFREQKEFYYQYDYPGEYVLTLSYFRNYYMNDHPDATDRLIIKVVPSDIYISSVGTDTDAYVEVENKSDFEIPLSRWILKGAIHSFVIPDGTVLLSKKKIKFSPHITSFDGSDMQSVILQNSNNETISTYPKVEVKAKIVKSTSLGYSADTVTKKDSIDKNSNSQIIDLNNLGASANSAESSSKISSKKMAWLGLGGVMILGVATTLFLRRKPKVLDSIDGEISPSDMTIVE